MSQRSPMFAHPVVAVLGAATVWGWMYLARPVPAEPPAPARHSTAQVDVPAHRTAETTVQRSLSRAGVVAGPRPSGEHAERGDTERSGAVADVGAGWPRSR